MRKRKLGNSNLEVSRSGPRLHGHELLRWRSALRVELTPDDLRTIDSSASKLKVEGERYPEHLEKMTGR